MPKSMILRGIAVIFVSVAAACAQAPATPTELDGDWEVQQIAGASLGEGVRIRLDVDAETGRISGFTGCNAFTAQMSAFGDTIAIGSPVEEDASCPSEAASTDEQRFLMVLGSVARFSRHGRALELLPRDPGEALIRLRYSDVQDAGGD